MTTQSVLIIDRLCIRSNSVKVVIFRIIVRHVTAYTSVKTGYSPSDIRFAFVTGEEINLLATKNISSYAVSVVERIFFCLDTMLKDMLKDEKLSATVIPQYLKVPFSPAKGEIN